MSSVSAPQWWLEPHGHAVELRRALVLSRWELREVPNGWTRRPLWASKSTVDLRVSSSSRESMHEILEVSIFCFPTDVSEGKSIRPSTLYMNMYILLITQRPELPGPRCRLAAN